MTPRTRKIFFFIFWSQPLLSVYFFFILGVIYLFIYFYIFFFGGWWWLLSIRYLVYHPLPDSTLGISVSLCKKWGWSPSACFGAIYWRAHFASIISFPLSFSPATFSSRLTGLKGSMFHYVRCDDGGQGMISDNSLGDANYNPVVLLFSHVSLGLSHPSMFHNVRDAVK